MFYPQSNEATTSIAISSTCRPGQSGVVCMTLKLTRRTDSLAGRMLRSILFLSYIDGVIKYTPSLSKKSSYSRIQKRPRKFSVLIGETSRDYLYSF